MKSWILIPVYMLIFSTNETSGQASIIKGELSNDNQQAVAGASIILRKADSSQIIGYAVSNQEGVFLLNVDRLSPGFYRLEVRHISYQNAEKLIRVPLDINDNAQIKFSLVPRKVELKEVIIKREPPMVMKSDTIQFNAGSFKNAETRKLEDLLKNINGFSVDASGKLSFNGKPVEKVLIEGDDVSDRSYQLLTRNLSAEIIDKIQVIDNYNDNRLKRNVSQSGNVGINLKMVPGLKNRINGSLGVGISVEKRYLAEGSLVYIASPLKILSFVNANNIAEDVSGNARYFYESEDGKEENAKRNAGDFHVLSAGEVFPPAINERYTRDNNDAGVSIMSSWKMGRHSRMKALMGAGWLKLIRTASARNNTFISDLENWVTENQVQEQRARRDQMAGFSFHRDAMKNHVTHVELAFGMGKQENGFNNLSSGAITDSLKEVLSDRDYFLDVKWEESFLLSTGKVFISSLVLHKAQISQVLENESGRFTSLYGLDSVFRISAQQLKGQHFSGEYTSGISGRYRKWQFQSGIQINRSASTYAALCRFTDSNDPHNLIDTGLQRLNVTRSGVSTYINTGRKSGKAGFLGIRLTAGYGWLDYKNMHSAFPVVKAELSYTYSLSLLSSVHLKYGFNADFVNFQQLYPLELISGDGTVLNGTQYLGTSKFHHWTAGYHSSNVYKNSQWSCNLSFSSAAGQYNNVLYSNPYNTVSGYMPFQPNAGLLAAVSGEKFIGTIKSKLGGSAYYSRNLLTYAINGDTGSSRRSAVSFEARWSTGLHLPVNLETRARMVWSEARWKQQSPNNNGQFFFTGKLKLNAGKKAYAAMVWNHYVLSKGSRFKGLDAFIHYSLNKDWKLSMQGSNLLNAATVRDKTVMAYSSSVSAFQLIGRYILIRAEVQL